MWTEAVVILNCLRLYVTVSNCNNSVNIQRDIISTLTPAVSMPCLDFTFLTPVETSVEWKKRRKTKFRCFTRNPNFWPKLTIFGMKMAPRSLTFHKVQIFFIFFFQISGKGRLGLLTGYCGQHLSRIKSPFRPIPNVWVVLFILFSFSKISKILKFSRHLSCDNCPKMWGVAV